MPMTLMSTSGSVVHIRPLPSDSTTETVPVSATAKLTPLIPTRAPRNSLRRWRARPPRPVPAGRRRGRRGASGSVRANSSRICSRFLWIAGTRMCDGVSSRELDDQLGQVGLPGADPALGQRLVELRLLGGQRLGLDHLVDAVAGDDIADDAVALLGVTRPVHDAAGPLHGLLERHQVVVEVAQHPLLERAAGLAQALPVGDLGDDPGALDPDGVGGVAEVVTQLRCRPARCAPPRETIAAPPACSTLVIPALRPWSRPGSRPGASCARPSAGATGLRRCASGTSCRRSRTPRRWCRGWSAPCRDSIAIEVSAFLIANVPPKPQHSIGRGQLDQVDALHGAQQPQGPVTDVRACAGCGTSGGR